MYILHHLAFAVLQSTDDLWSNALLKGTEWLVKICLTYFLGNRQTLNYILMFLSLFKVWEIRR